MEQTVRMAVREVCGPEGADLLIYVYYQISGNAIYAYQVRCMHVHVVHFLRLSHARAKSEFLTLPKWDQPAKGDNPGPPGSLGVGLTTPPWEKKSRKLKKQQPAMTGRSF
jgi:hypothetical protein